MRTFTNPIITSGADPWVTAVGEEVLLLLHAQ